MNMYQSLSLLKEVPIDQESIKAALVSVIIPCYNHARFLGQAIESVLNQSYPHVEIIVVDDGSVDNTAVVAGHYPEVHYVRQENQGLSAARNTGLRQSRGDFLVFLDADDLLAPGALEAGLNCLKAQPEAAFVSGHYRYIQEDGSSLSEHPQEPIQDDYYLALLRGNYIGMHATVMYRRTAIEAAGGFDTSLPACEDYDLYLRLGRKFPIARHDKLVAEYRQHRTNMSGNAELMLKTSLAVLRAHRPEGQQFKEAYQAGVKFWQEYYGEKLLQQIAHLRSAGAHREAVQRRLTLLRYAPQYYIKQVGWLICQPAFKMISSMLPVPLRRRLVRWWGLDYYPPVGKADLGDLRRLTPLSRVFGYDRGQPIDRYYIESFLAAQASDIRGRVLEIGDDSYTRRFGGERVTTRDILHAVAGNPQATFVADLTSADHIPSNTFDCIILTQTLHLIYDFHSALKTIYRTLKPGGVLLATVPGISQVSIDEWAERWYWAFTSLSVRRLLLEAFPEDNIKVEARGNVLAATALLNGLAAEELQQEELDHTDPQYQLLITIRAVKPE